MGALPISATSLLPDGPAIAHNAVVVLTGRRIDADNAEVARFPLANVAGVKKRIRDVFARSKPIALVSAAACGSDLIALEVAGEMKIERIVLLPSDPVKFRASSVADRPGDWGPMFDRLQREVELEVVKVPEGDAGYLETNLRLIGRAESIAKKRGVPVRAMVVWDGKLRGVDDVTGHFLAQARKRKIPVLEIPTLP